MTTLVVSMVALTRLGTATAAASRLGGSLPAPGPLRRAGTWPWPPDLGMGRSLAARTSPVLTCRPGRSDLPATSDEPMDPDVEPASHRAPSLMSSKGQARWTSCDVEGVGPIRYIQQPGICGPMAGLKSMDRHAVAWS